MGQKYAAYNSSGKIIGFYDSVDSPVPFGVSAVAITPLEWQECLSNNGYTVANGALVPPPEPTAAQLLEASQAAQIAVLTSACQAQIVAGYTSSALGSAHTYPSKPTDQMNMNVAVTASLLPGIPTTWTTPFWCADSTGAWAMVEHTAAQIQQAGSDGKAAIQAARVKLATLAAQVQAATTTSAVQAIAW